MTVLLVSDQVWTISKVTVNQPALEFCTALMLYGRLPCVQGQLSGCGLREGL